MRAFSSDVNLVSDRIKILPSLVQNMHYHDLPEALSAKQERDVMLQYPSTVIERCTPDTIHRK
jgi:hypothetical protein